jgi:PPOX class probable F420-dependent enzyme
VDARNLAGRYNLPIVDWSTATARLDAGIMQAPGTGGPDRHAWWLATIDPDGRPHVTGIGAAWYDGTLWFSTGRTSRKGRNLARDPRCTLSVSTSELDLVVEGTAQVVDDPALVGDYATRAAADGWPAEPDESGTAVTAPYSAPSAGPPPWHVYRVTPSAATVLLVAEPGGATRFRFS